MIERLPSGKYRVRWDEAGRSGGRLSRTFERRQDAKVFEAELTRRRALGDLAFVEAANKRVEELAAEWWGDLRQAQPRL